MENEQTKKTDTPGTETDKPVAPDGEPVSDYDKALELVKRREKATKAEKEVLEEKKALAANEMVSGTSGGHVDAPVVSPEEAKKAGAKEFFKGTQLENAIDKL